MKMKNLFLFYITSATLIFFSSCTEKKIEYFKLNIVYSEPLTELKEGDIMPSHLISLINYYEDTACTDRVFFPNVVFYRSDLIPSKNEEFVVPLTSVNEFRKSCNMLSGINLMEDYDENISKLKIPKLLIELSKSKNNGNIQLDKFQKVIIVPVDKFNVDSIKIVRDKISHGLCKGRSNDIITVMFIKITNDSISADSALTKFYVWRNERQRNASEIDSTLQGLERQYPNDYRFTIERLRLKNDSGEINESDEYLLLLAVEKAIKEGKASELLALIKKMNLPKKTKEKAKRSIGEKQVIKAPVLPPDKAISFRKSKIEVKLSILADANYNSRDRKLFMDITLGDFENPDSRVSIESSDTSMTVSIKSIEDYLNQLRFSKNYKVKVLSFERGHTGKIASIKVSESY